MFSVLDSIKALADLVAFQLDIADNSTDIH